jgi:hypothetical protein
MTNKGAYMKSNETYNEFAGRAYLAIEEILLETSEQPTAEFYAGTLFVKCNAYAAAKIETALRKALNCGVIVSKVGPEYSFDFVGV